MEINEHQDSFVWLTAMLLTLLCASLSCLPAQEEDAIECSPLEAVLKQGDVVIGTTASGTIEIKAMNDCKRQFEWKDNVRELTMWPRPERWGQARRLGLYYPGPGYHWMRTSDNIRRAVVDESEVHFETLNDAITWLEKISGWFPTVYNDDGLVLSFGMSPSRYQLEVGIYQIYVNGEKPIRIPGSTNSKIEIIRFQRSD